METTKDIGTFLLRWLPFVWDGMIFSHCVSGLRASANICCLCLCTQDGFLYKSAHVRSPTPHHLLWNRSIFLMDTAVRGRAEIVSIDFIFGRLRSGHLVLQYTLPRLPLSHHPSASHWRHACPTPLYMPPSSPSTSLRPSLTHTVSSALL